MIKYVFYIYLRFFGFIILFQAHKNKKTDQGKRDKQTVDEQVKLTFLIINVDFFLVDVI